VVSALALGCYFIEGNFRQVARWRRTGPWILVFLVFLAAYFGLIKRISAIQTINYAASYAHDGILGNIQTLWRSFSGLLGMPMFVVLAMALVSLGLSRVEPHAKKVLLFTACIGAGFAVLSAIGLYPASKTRHLIWAYGVVLPIVYFGVVAWIGRPRKQRLVGWMMVVVLLGLGVKRTQAMWTTSFEITENRAALEFLERQDSSYVGTWIGGPPVIDYYRKIDPALGKHRFFGMLQDSSRIIAKWAPREIRFLTEARALVAAAPKAREFFIFASHYSIHETEPFQQVAASKLHEAMEESGCSYRMEREFKMAAIYKVNCPQR
jgi:hypothetical protein